MIKAIKLIAIIAVEEKMLKIYATIMTTAILMQYGYQQWL